MAVTVSGSGDDTASPEFLLFPLALAPVLASHTPSYFIQLEVQKCGRDATHCSCVTDAPGVQPVSGAHRIGRDCHTIYQSLPWALCRLHSQFHHIQNYYIFSPSSVFPLQVAFKNISIWSWNTLRKASVHVILSDQRQRKSGFLTIHQIPFGPENFTVVLCQAAMPAFSKMSQDKLNRNCILGILLNNAFPNLLRIKIFCKPQKHNSMSHEPFPVNKNAINLFSS